jgi:hypothetical protein
VRLQVEAVILIDYGPQKTNGRRGFFVKSPQRKPNLNRHSLELVGE